MIRTALIQTLALLVAAILLIPSCDPNYTGFWYIENQLDEDIIVTRSDSTEIHNVAIKAVYSNIPVWAVLRFLISNSAFQIHISLTHWLL